MPLIKDLIPIGESAQEMIRERMIDRAALQKVITSSNIRFVLEKSDYE